MSKLPISRRGGTILVGALARPPACGGDSSGSSGACPVGGSAGSSRGAALTSDSATSVGSGSSGGSSGPAAPAAPAAPGARVVPPVARAAPEVPAPEAPVVPAGPGAPAADPVVARGAAPGGRAAGARSGALYADLLVEHTGRSARDPHPDQLADQRLLLHGWMVVVLGRGVCLGRDRSRRESHRSGLVGMAGGGSERPRRDRRQRRTRHRRRGPHHRRHDRPQLVAVQSDPQHDRDRLRYAATDVVSGTGWGTPSPFLGAGVVAAGSSELAGLLVQAETDAGDIQHALQIELPQTQNMSGYDGDAIFGGRSFLDGYRTRRRPTRHPAWYADALGAVHPRAEGVPRAADLRRVRYRHDRLLHPSATAPSRMPTIRTTMDALNNDVGAITKLMQKVQ